MIKKDIVLDSHEVKPDKQPIEETNNIEDHQQIFEESVDDVFAAADIEMENKSAELLKIKNKKEKKRRPFVRLLLSSTIIFLGLLIVFVVIVMREMKIIFPEMKASLVQQFAYMQENVYELDDKLLSESEYYQKQILLLMTPEEVEESIDNIIDMSKFADLLNADGQADISIIPEDKVEEYKELIRLYEEAVEKEERTERTEETSALEE